MATYHFEVLPSGVTDQEIAAALAAVQAYFAVEVLDRPREMNLAWLRAARLEGVGLKPEPGVPGGSWRH